MTDTNFQLKQQAVDAHAQQQRAAAIQQCQNLSIAIFIRTIAGLSPRLAHDEFLEICKQSANRAQIASVMLLKESFGLPLEIRQKEDVVKDAMLPSDKS